MLWFGEKSRLGRDGAREVNDSRASAKVPFSWRMKWNEIVSS